MLIEGASRGPLCVDGMKIVRNLVTNLHEVELELSQFYSYGKYRSSKVPNCTMHYSETRKCRYRIADVAGPDLFIDRIVDGFLDANRAGVIFHMFSEDVMDVLDYEEVALLQKRDEQNVERIKLNGQLYQNFQEDYEGSLDFYLDKHVVVNDDNGYSFYGKVGRFQFVKACFSRVPIGDVDFRSTGEAMYLDRYVASPYLLLNRQRMKRCTVELEQARMSETVELRAAKHYELTTHFQNVKAAVVLSGDPQQLEENLKAAGTFINSHNENRVIELSAMVIADPISVLSNVKALGTAYLLDPENRYQEAYEQYLSTCSVLIGFLFGAVNAGLRINMDWYFEPELTAEQLLKHVLCQVDYLACESSLLIDEEKQRPFIDFTTHVKKQVMAHLGQAIEGL